jgi:hypothetical protein
MNKVSFIVKNIEDLRSVSDRGRCVICGQLGDSFHWGSPYKDNPAEKLIICSPECETLLEKILEGA